MDGFCHWSLRPDVNQDTPKDDELYKLSLTTVIYLSKGAPDIANGNYNLFLVQPGQLQRYKGHMTRFGSLLQQPSFLKNIGRIHIDESRFTLSDNRSMTGPPSVPFADNSAKFISDCPRNSHSKLSQALFLHISRSL
jgi:hypothetical protein